MSTSLTYSIQDQQLHNLKLIPEANAANHKNPPESTTLQEFRCRGRKNQEVILEAYTAIVATEFRRHAWS